MVRRPKKLSLADLPAVLAGRLQPRMEELFDLIHKVNPTGRVADTNRAAQAYAHKARLQSLLIERFGDALVVTEVETAPGTAQRPEPSPVVGLRHRTYDKDACHAVVADLSAQAQAWVRLQRDLRADGNDAAALPVASGTAPKRLTMPAPPAATGPEALFAQGAAALAAFDFERAREHFAAAVVWPVTRTDGHVVVRAARALLEVLVDRLADDQSALAVRQSLPADAASDVYVRSLLALAAARQGEQGLALQLVADAQGEHAHATYLELARAALAVGDVQACEHHLTQVPPNTGFAAQAQSLSAAARHARAEAAGPLERRLAAALAAGDFARDAEQIEQLARELLTLHPGSEAGHRAVAAVRQARAQSAAAQLTAQVRAALDADEPAVASAFLRQLETLQGPRSDLRARLHAVEQRQAQVQERTAIAELAAGLATELTSHTVAAYWSASEAVRQAARQGAPEPTILWLEAFGEVKGNASCAAVASACNDVPRAEQELAVEQPVRASGVLWPHTQLLRSCEPGRQLLDRVQAAMAAHRRRVAGALLEEAERADLAHACAVVSRLQAADLDGEGQARLAMVTARLQRDELLARARRQRLRRLGVVSLSALALAAALVMVRAYAAAARRNARSAQEVAFDDAQAGGDFLAARNLAAQLASASTTDVERAAWAARQAEAERKVREVFLKDECTGAVVKDWDRDFWPQVDTTQPQVAVTPQGDAVVTVRQHDALLFVRVVDLRDAARSRAAVFDAGPTFDLKGTHVEDRHAVILGSQQTLTVNVDTFDVVDAIHYAAIHGTQVNTAIRVVPGGEYMWLDWIQPSHLGPLWVQGKAIRGGTTVFGRRDGQRVRSLAEFSALVPVWGLPSPAVAISHSLTDFTLMTASGERLWDDDGQYTFHSAVVHPDGQSLVVIKRLPRPRQEGSGFTLVAETWSMTGKREHALPLCWLPRGNAGLVATALECGHTFVCAETGEAQYDLVALRAGQPGLVETWRRQCGAPVFLAHDAQCRRVVAFVHDGEQANWIPMSATPPAPHASVPRLQEPPAFDPYCACEWTPASTRERVQAYGAVLPLLGADTIRTRVQVLLGGALDVTSGTALWLCAPAAQRADILHAVAAQHGTAPTVAILSAEQAVHEARHADALRALDGLAPAGLEPCELQHADHLRALCHLALGREDLAQQAIARALAQSAAGCWLQPLSQWVETLTAPIDQLVTALRAGAHGTTRRGFVSRVRVADRLLAQGDAVGAATTLEHPAVWLTRDVQGQARLADAYLRLPADDAATRVRQREVLASFCARCDSAPPALHFSLGSANYSRTRLDSLAAQARGKLGVGARGEPPAQAGGEQFGQPTPTTAWSHAGATFVTTMVAAGIPAGAGTVLPQQEADQVMRRHEADLLEQARALTRNLIPRVVLVVADPSHKAAAHLRAAREQLCGTRGAGPETAVVVTLGGACNLLADWPHVFQQFQEFNNTSILNGEFTILLLRNAGAAWRRAR
jgi:hypothetical protein